MDPNVIIAGATGLQNGLNAAATAHQNKKSRQFSLEMYEKQKKDAMEFWNLQNAYNDPQAQMKRLQEAGLNPNMIYGAGSGGASGTADSIKTPDVQSAQFRAPEITGLPNSIMMMYDVAIKNAQVDNIKANTTNTQEETILKGIQAHGMAYDNSSKYARSVMDQQLMEMNADFLKEKLRQLKISNQYQLDETDRAILLFEPRLENAVQDVISKKLGQKLTDAQITALGLDTEVKKLDASLARMGVRPQDPFYAKAVATLVGKILQQFGKKPNLDSIFDLF